MLRKLLGKQFVFSSACVLQGLFTVILPHIHPVVLFCFFLFTTSSTFGVNSHFFCVFFHFPFFTRGGEDSTVSSYYIY